MRVIAMNKRTFDIIEINQVDLIEVIGTGGTHIIVHGIIAGADAATNNQFARDDYIVRIMNS